MDMNKHEFMTDNVTTIKDEAFDITGAAVDVLNSLGHGFHEKVYENALEVEFKIRKISFKKQPQFDVVYKEKQIGHYIPDFIANDLIVELKTIDKIGLNEIGQIINYLKVTGLKSGIILNFKNAKLEWKRVSL